MKTSRRAATVVLFIGSSLGMASVATPGARQAQGGGGADAVAGRATRVNSDAAQSVHHAADPAPATAETRGAAGQLATPNSHLAPRFSVYDVKDFGARGDGRTLDTDAINRAIEAAAEAGGATVLFPAGVYPSFSIHLRSHVSLYIGEGATLLAATPAEGVGGYDPPEPGPASAYQDFGHSHWQNSLMWGIGVENVSILGPGLIDGEGLWRGLEPPLGPAPGPDPGNKAISLKLSRNIRIRDISILNGGHFAILATGVDNLTIDNVRIDTNRDGINIDACRNVRISNTSVNSPNDDAIVLKSSFALDGPRFTENVTITNSAVSGYAIGTLLDGTYQRTVTHAPDRDGPTGRIKFGTESNAGFRNITISNVVFDRSRGLALETVDGGLLEDITITNITMREVSNAPIFLRLGSRMRGPEGTPVGKLRRVRISNVVVYDADPRYASIISGIPGHPIEDVELSDIRILYRGGLTLDDVARQPADLVNSFFFRGEDAGPRDPWQTPERADAYPETSMFGIIPAYGFFIRHADGIELNNVEVGFMAEDRRPAFVIQSARDIELHNVDAQTAVDVPSFVLVNVDDFRAYHTRPFGDVHLEHVDRREF